jgi:signal peptidase complex subunit 1
MDFCGQQLAERIYYFLILFSGIFGFIYGYHTQSVADMMFVFISGTGLAVLLTCPPWPFYNSNPEKWLKPLKEEETVIKKEKKNSKFL